MTTLTAPKSYEPLVATDRCDRCKAPAKLRAVLVNGELMLCAHHARSHYNSLSSANAVLVGDSGNVIDSSFSLFDL